MSEEELGGELSPELRERIRSTVRRFTRPAVGPRRAPKVGEEQLERVIRALRRQHGIPDDDAARGAAEVAQLLERPAGTRYAELLTRPELARPAVVLALYGQARAAIAAGSAEAVALARLGLAVASCFSGAHYPASLTLDCLGEGWLLLALAHLERRRLAEAEQAFHLAHALLRLSESSTGDAKLCAEMLLAEGLIEFAAGNSGHAVQSFQEAVQEYAGAGETAAARAAARLLGEASLGRQVLAAAVARGPRELASERRQAHGALSHVRAVWRALRSSNVPAPDPKETA